MVSLIIFDAGGVLYENLRKEVILNYLVKFLNSYGYTSPPTLEEMWNNLYKLGRIGKLSFRECNLLLFEKIGAKELVGEWIKFYKKLWKKYAKAKDSVNFVLGKLKEKEYKMAILSNSVNSGKEKVRFLKLSGINPSLFDAIFTSHDIGYPKPHKLSYITVLTHFKLMPFDAIFISDNEKEIEGAYEVGIRPIYIGRYKPFRATYCIKSLKELLCIL